MGALFDDFSVVDHQDQVRVFHGAQPVGDDQGGTALDHRFDGVLDLLLRQGIHRRGGFVQHQDPRIRQNGPGE